jgi:methionyl-tRNA formyltransferase
MAIFSKSVYYVCCSKIWVKDVAQILSQKTGCSFVQVESQEELNRITSLRERATLFFFHWSYLLKKDVYENHDCVMFHMTDLPYGRGGSPLQNLIVRGHKETKISAFLCDGGIDTGPLFLKRPLSLDGKAQDIFVKATQVMIEMVQDILLRQPSPVTQVGEVVEFKRRRPEDGNLENVDSFDQIYDFIRMLDADGYPRAYLKTKVGTFFFEDVRQEDGEFVAKVRIKR